MIYIHTLGASYIDAAGTRFKPTSVRKFALLLHLSAERGRCVSRAVLRDLICPDRSDRHAQHLLRELVYELRVTGVRIESDALGLTLTDEVRWDYTELIECERPDEVLLKAAEGGFLPGYTPTHSEAFTEWYETYRARVILDLCKALVNEVHRARSVADWGATERAARACLALDALNEEATLTRAEVLAIGGSKAKAVQLLDQYMVDVGTSSADLRLPAGVLKRRIAERVPDSYRPASTLTFVGREDEMLRAAECFQRARAGERQCLVIGGEPGIGKSRLASELQNSILLSGAETRRVTMQPHDARRPLSVFMELVPQLLQMRGAIGCSPESLQLLRRLTERQPDPTPTEMKPEELHVVSAALIKGIRDLIDSIASEVPLGLFVDDAQWLDPLSQQTLVDLGSVRARARLLLVLTTRNHRVIAESFRNAEQLRVVSLKRLDPRSVMALVAQMASSGANALSEATAASIVATAGGNPLFAILLAREVSCGGVETQPRSLTELLGRRLDVLDSRERAILTACVAIGRSCTIDRLLAALEMPHIELLAALTRLTEAGLLRTDCNTIEPGHPLIAEVLRELSEPSLLRAAHHRAAQILEREAFEQRSTSLYWESADRWLIAGNYIRASAALRECARHALSLGRAGEAVEMLQRACELEVPTTELTNALRELVLAGQLATDSRVVRVAAARLHAVGDCPEHDDVEHAVMASYFNLVDFGPDMATRLRACVRAHDSPPVHRVRAATWLLKLADIEGHSAVISEIPLELGDDALRQVPELLSLEFRLVYCTATVQPALAIQTARRMEQLAKAQPVQSLAQQLTNIGLAYWVNGATEDSIRIFNAAYEQAAQLGLPAIQLKYAVLLTLWFFDLGSDDQCDHWLAQARQSAKAEPELADDFNLLVQEVDIAIVRRDSERALDIIRHIEVRRICANTEIRARWLTAVQFWARCIQNQLNESDELLALALLRNERPSMTGVVDFEAAVACTVLSALGRGTDAARELKAFLRRRMSLRPLSRNVQASAVELGIDLSTMRS